MKSSKIKFVALAVAVLLLAGVFAGVLTACDNGGSADDNTLIFMAYQPANETIKGAYNQILDAFTAETGVKVKPIYVPKDNYNTKLSSNFRSKNSKPDVFYLDQPMLADYVEQCLNLDTGFFAEEGEDGLKKSDFFASAMDTAVYKNSVYAVPLSLTSSIILYNKSLVSEVPANWDEWLAQTPPDGKALFSGIGSGGYASWYFQAFLKSAGGEMISGNQAVFNNEKAVAAAQMVANLYAKSPKNVRDTTNAFVNGNVLFTLAHSADVVNYFNTNGVWCAENMGATLFIPQETGGTSYSNIGGENLAIRKDSGKEENAKALVKYLLREENVVKIIGQNFSAVKAYAKVPSQDPITGAQYADVVKEAFQVILQQLETASARPAVKNWTQVNDTYLANALAAILDNGANIQEKLTEAVNQANSILDFD